MGKNTKFIKKNLFVILEISRGRSRTNLLLVLRKKIATNTIRLLRSPRLLYMAFLDVTNVVSSQVLISSDSRDATVNENKYLIFFQ